MRFGDYDHDGQATEFILQVGTLPCGKKMSVAIGVSRQNPRLHVFSTAEHPERPLVLQAWQWESLLGAKAPIKVTDWKCGDHGSDAETELELSADENGIHATNWTYECDQDGRRGKLTEQRGALRHPSTQSFGQVSMYFCLCCPKAFRKSSFPCTLLRSSTAT